MVSPPPNPSPLLFLSLLLFVAGTAAAAGFDDFDFAKEKKTHLHFFFHEILAGPNETSTVVASLHLNSSSPFGNLRVFDNALRETVDPSSKLVGRAQGFAASASLTDWSVLTAINFVFTEGEFNGSSLALVGRVDAAAAGFGDRTVVGGSGRFRLARGFALSNIVNTSATGIIVEFDFYVMHY